MTSPFMMTLIEKINNNNSQSPNMLNNNLSNPIISFSAAIDTFNVNINNNNNNDKIKEFLTAKKYICTSTIRKSRSLKNSINEISKLIDIKTPMILNIEYNLNPKGIHIPLYTEMKLNLNEYYNKLKYLSLLSIDFENNNIDYNEIFKYLYPMILINYYKFLVIKELLPESKNDHLSIINILIKLTSLSCSPSPSSISIDSPKDHVKFQNNLISPFD